MPVHPTEHGDEDDGDRSLGDRILSAVPDGLWMLDDEGRTTFANATMGALLGRDDEEMASTSVFDVLDEQSGAQFRGHLAGRDSEAPGHDLECLVHRRDGSS